MTFPHKCENLSITGKNVGLKISPDINPSIIVIIKDNSRIVVQPYIYPSKIDRFAYHSGADVKYFTGSKNHFQ